VYEQAKEGNQVPEVVRTSSGWCKVGDVGGGGLCGFNEVSTGDRGVGCGQARARSTGGGEEVVLKRTEDISTILWGGDTLCLSESECGMGET